MHGPLVIDAAVVHTEVKQCVMRRGGTTGSRHMVSLLVMRQTDTLTSSLKRSLVWVGDLMSTSCHRGTGLVPTTGGTWRAGVDAASVHERAPDMRVVPQPKCERRGRVNRHRTRGGGVSESQPQEIEDRGQTETAGDTGRSAPAPCGPVDCPTEPLCNSNAPKDRVIHFRFGCASTRAEFTHSNPLP